MGSLSSADEVAHSVRQEIIRFESVHPSIYAIYDLIDAIEDKNISESLRQLVVSIEDAFVNSQEWTLSYCVPDIKLGLLGSVQSGKSALVHRYLTGTYLHEESPEGGRFKKEVSVDNQSHLLLIRDEGGPPDQQFSHWVDGIIFVFSLENFESYQTVYDYFARLTTYRNTSNLPILLVGTQDSNCEPYVRVVDDARARKLASDLDRCVYYETCAAYGLNVERVFQDACLRILHARSAPPAYQPPRPTTPQFPGTVPCRPNANASALSNSSTSVPITNTSDKSLRPLTTTLPPTVNVRRPDMLNNPGFEPDPAEEANDALTPSGTPTHSRKNRRKSNLFQKKNEDDKKLNGIGSGRSIPLKQGFLYKRTCKPLSKEWKTKKYVTLTEDARLTYHPSIHDYMENAHGKEIDLSRTTVKIPGVPFRQVGGRITSNGLLRSHLNDTASEKPSTSSKNTGSSDNIPTFSDSVTPGTKDSISVKKRHRRLKPNPKTNVVDGYDSEGYEFQLISMDRQWHFEAKGPEERDEWVMYIERAIMTRLQLNESSKRTRSVNTTATGSGFTNSTTGCNASVPTNRSVGDTNSLTSGRSGAGDTSELAVTERFVRCISAVAGNEYCADCGAPDPDWASLNLGVVVCISCSGIHRQLGTHISRIRSLHLDEWSPESVSVMCAIGNTLANSVWEAAVPVNAGNRKKPEPSGSREEKEAWIRAKYDHQEFLPPLPYPDAPLQQQLIDAIARQDTRQVVLCLALATPETVNAAYSRQDPRAAIHIAATLGNLVYLQLLLWYNGDPTITDHEGRNAYYYAHCSQKYDCADFLRRNGCPKQLVPPNTPALSVGPLARSLQSAPLSQPQTLPIIHGQLGSSGLYPLSVPIEAHGSFAGHSSTTIPSTAAQPYHFSHLQQQQSGSVACHTAGLAPSHPPFSSQQPGFVPIFVNPVTTSSQSYLHGPVGSSGAATHSSVLQSVSNAALPTPPSGMVGSNSGGLAYRSTCGQQFPVTSTAYTVSVNQALGATLPRRRAPPSNIVSAAVQQFNQHSSQNHPLSTGTHRPHSGALIDRAVVGVVRPSLIGVPSPASSTPITTAYDRTTAIAAALTGNPSGTYQHLVTSNQEVGL